MLDAAPEDVVEALDDVAAAKDVFTVDEAAAPVALRAPHTPLFVRGPAVELLR